MFLSGNSSTCSPTHIAQIRDFLDFLHEYCEEKPEKVLVPQATADFTLRVSKSYVSFKCKFSMIMHFGPIPHRLCRSKTNFYVFSYDKISSKLCASFRFFLAVFMKKFQIIRYLNYVRRGIVRNY